MTTTGRTAGPGSRPRGRRLAVGAAALVLLPVLAACGASAGHVRDICGDVTSGTAELARFDPGRPVTALELAIGRFDLVEEAVSKAREAALPGDAAPTLRTDWLEPAVASMAGWQTTLGSLRTAVAGGDAAAVQAALGDALALGTTGVDTGALRAAGYDACATAFTAPDVGELTR